MTREEVITVLGNIKDRKLAKKLLDTLRTGANANYDNLFAAPFVGRGLLNNAEHQKLTLKAEQFKKVIDYLFTEKGHIEPLPTIPVKLEYRRPLFDLLKPHFEEEVDFKAFNSHFIKPTIPEDFDRLVCDLGETKLAAIFFGHQQETKVFNGLLSKDITKNIEIVAGHFYDTNRNPVSHKALKGATNGRADGVSAELKGKVWEHFRSFQALWSSL